MATKQKVDTVAKETALPKKHKKALLTFAGLQVSQLRELHPDWPLKQVLTDILSTANPDMPPQFLLEFTQHIINHWVAMEEKEKQAVAA